MSHLLLLFHKTSRLVVAAVSPIVGDFLITNLGEYLVTDAGDNLVWG